jgi:hypothetical protein
MTRPNKNKLSLISTTKILPAAPKIIGHLTRNVTCIEVFWEKKRGPVSEKLSSVLRDYLCSKA